MTAGVSEHAAEQRVLNDPVCVYVQRMFLEGIRN